LSPVSTGMGDCLRAGIPPWYVTKPTRSTQPCIPLGSLNRVLALIGWGKGGNVTYAGWQVTLCDPIWHASSRSGAVLVAQTAIRFFTFFYSPKTSSQTASWLSQRFPHNTRSLPINWPTDKLTEQQLNSTSKNRPAMLYPQHSHIIQIYNWSSTVWMLTCGRECKPVQMVASMV